MPRLFGFRRGGRAVWPLVLVLALGAGCGEGKVPNGGPAVHKWDGGEIITPALVIETASPENGIVGTMAMGGTEVTFSSKYDPETGNTVARMRGGGDAGNQMVVVTMSSSNGATRSTATMAMGGQQISGDGPPSAAQQSALAAMGASPMGPAMAMLPLELGCKLDPGVTDRERAALLVPWQMLIKYDPTFPSSDAFERAASCRYFEPAEQNQSYVDGGTPPPRGRGVRLANDDRVPNIFGIFPFDGTGAVDPTAQFGHDTRPCTALCFGTCGPDCDATACTSSYEWYCLKGAANT
ncbi:MAG: hypothetical protein ABIW57_02950, partial [Polyangia bacterium]